MNGITIGTTHSYVDLGLILTKKTIGAAVAKTQTIDIPGADGVLDYTEYFGKILYQNRPLSFEFSTVAAPSTFLTLYSQVQRLFHGRKLKITLDEDPDYYYYGRITVNEWASNGRIGKLVIDVNAEPYKLKQSETVVSQMATGASIVTCNNLMREVTPTLTASGDATLTFGTYTRTLSANTPVTDDNIIFVEGQNVLTVTPSSGTVAVTIEYQEGEL